MVDVAYMEELDSAVNMRSIISKLPYKLRERWRAIACGEQHSMEHCKTMIRSLYKEKIDFLRNKGLCFSCLKSGHMSKACEDRLSCQYCQMSHPTVLHMKAKVVPTEVKHKGVPSDNGDGQSVISGCIGAKTSTCGTTTRDNVDSILAIVPIKVKVKDNKVVMMYAFLDPGSMATFCMEKLMATLNLTGRNTSILLKTMGDKRMWISGHILVKYTFQEYKQE
ncbi:hypothetical protein SRHO_G00040850 [Serrasalmus rhombeus]